jgi:putative thioredoxin
MKEITDFTKDVLERSSTLPVLVDFWAAWCGPCRVLGPVLERLEARSGGRWVLAKVDTDAHQDIAAQYGIRGIPNVKLFVDRRVVHEFTGALPERAVEQWLEKALPNPHTNMLQEAESLIRGGDPARGRALLQEILTADPGNDHARVLLSRTYLFENPARVSELVAGIEEHSEHYHDAEALRTVIGLFDRAGRPESFPVDNVRERYCEAIEELRTRNFDAALEKFIAVLKENRQYDGDGSRRAVIAIFKILGDEHPLTLKHRRGFSSALFV